MCQAYAGEQSYLFSRASNARRDGYDAYSDGKHCWDNPYIQSYDKDRRNHWMYGFIAASEGQGLW